MIMPMPMHKIVFAIEGIGNMAIFWERMVLLMTSIRLQFRG